MAGIVICILHTEGTREAMDYVSTSDGGRNEGSRLSKTEEANDGYMEVWTEQGMRDAEPWRYS